MKTFIVAALVAVFVLTPAAWSQIVTVGTGTLQNTTTTTPTPYGNFYKGGRLQCLILASELTAAGAASAQLTTIGFDVVTPGGAPLSAFTIKMGHTLATDLSGGWDDACVAPVFGPTTYQDVVGWNDHALTSPFSWDGTSNLIVEVCFWNGTASSYTTNGIINYDMTSYVSSLTYRSDSVDPCSPAGMAFNPQYSESERPNMRFTIGGAPIPPGYQTNSVEASLDIDGVKACSSTPAIVNQTAYLCGGTAGSVTGSINLSTNGVSNVLYEVVMDSSPVVSLTAGGLPILGEILNLSVASAANWNYLNGGSTLSFQPFPGLGIPGVTGSNISMPYSINSQFDLSMQAAMLAPTFATGLKLTQASELHVVVSPSVASIPGPGDSYTNVEVNVSGGSTCWAPNGVPFYGTNYNTMYVSPNGFIAFGGGGDTDTTPSVSDAIYDDARVGFWTNFDPSEGGTVNILNPGPDIIRVEWNGVWYDLGGPANTFAIEIDCATGVILMDGLQGIVANPGTSTTDDQWLGISPGMTMVATDPGAQAFSVLGTGTALSPTDMLYEFNDTSVSLSGLPACIVGGLNQLLFTPDGLGNYAWSGF